MKPRSYINDIKIKLIENGYIIKSKDDEYINMTTNLLFECPCCHKEFKRTPKMALKSNKECVKCIQKNTVGKKLHEQKLNVNELQNFMNEIQLDEYEIIDNTSTIKFKCESCGKNVERKYDRMKKSTYPKKCEPCGKKSSNNPKTNKDIVNKKLKEFNSNTVCIEDGFFTLKDKVKFKCECGNIFIRKTNTVLSSKLFQCNECSHKISNSEKIIMNVLDDLNIDYIFQKTFNDCKNKYCLPFDFYLPLYNTIIEYDGELHYKDLFGNLENQLNNDDIKNNYCIKNNIRLIRIPYWENNNIEKIIKDFVYDNIVPSQLEITERCND